MPPDFLIRAAFAGLGVALAAGPLGCFVVWRRMAYFSDATSHAALLGVALALVAELPLTVGVVIMALAMGAALLLLADRGQSNDAVLGVLAHTALAGGVVAVAMMPRVQVDLTGLLFGDILSVGMSELAVIWGGAAAVGALLLWRWHGLVTATLNPDLAVADGVSPKREEAVLTLALALTVALALKAVGALLIAAMLVIPAAAARSFARTPEAMAAIATAIGGLSALGGLAASWHWDTPTGPTIVLTAAACFSVSMLVRRLMRR